MGAHYRSLQIRGKSQDDIIAAVENQIRARKGKALVGPQLNGWTAIYLGDFAPCEGLVSTLARELNTKVLDLTVHDSDIFIYSFYDADRLLRLWNWEERNRARMPTRIPSGPFQFRREMASVPDTTGIRGILSRNKKHHPKNSSTPKFPGLASVGQIPSDKASPGPTGLD